MPIIKSAKKRVKIAAKATARNARTKRTMREASKAFYNALASGKADKIALTQQKANSAIDIAVKKNIIHKNKAARKKRQLSNAIKSAKITLTAVKKPVTKTAPKKSVTKKASAKKPTAKSAPKKTVKKSTTK